MIEPPYPGRPGLRRQVSIDPRREAVRAEVEDDFHNFVVTLHHRGGRITGVDTGAPRHPWTSCPAAGPFLASRIVGTALAEVPSLEAPLTHCTHMLDLAIVGAAHAHDAASIRFDMFVSDAAEHRRRADLWRGDTLVLGWDLEDDMIVAGPAAGKNLRRLRNWLPDEPQWLHEPARMLRRAIFISGGRLSDYEHVETAADMGMQSGACFTFQPERAAHAHPIDGSKRDFTFSARGEPVSIRPAS